MNAKNAALGERIRQARKTLGLTQQEFALQLAVTQPTVHRWEKGFYDPDEEALQRLSGMTRLSPAYFRYGEHNGHSHAGTAALDHYLDRDGQLRHCNGEARTVASPPGDRQMAALEVRSDDLAPLFRQGDVVFYAVGIQGVDARCLGKECVAKVMDGPTLLRRVERGSHRNSYTLSLVGATTVADAPLAWASPVRWIQRS